VTTQIDPRLEDMNMADAPETSSFMYTGRLVVEEWVFLPLEKRTRPSFVKADVPYYHVAVQPMSYKITDGGMEGDNLEHTYVAIKTAQGELTPKNTGRDELVKAFTKLGFPRNTVKDLQNNPAIGKVFTFKRYNRQYKRGTETVPGELMNVPWERLDDNWQPAPGTEVPAYARAPRARSGGESSGIASGAVARPIGVTLTQVADALVGQPATDAAVRAFVLDRNDLSTGEALDLALKNELFGKLINDGLITNNGGVIARA